MIRQYEITLHSLLGNREGKMEADIQGEKLSGFFKVLRREQHFTGTIDACGNCSIDGTLASLKKLQKYHGVGIIDAEKVCLTLQIGPVHLSMSGTAMEGGSSSDG